MKENIIWFESRTFLLIRMFEKNILKRTEQNVIMTEIGSQWNQALEFMK